MDSCSPTLRRYPRTPKAGLSKLGPSDGIVVTPGTVWVASSYHSRSFDSRYFGPVYTTAIRHRLKALLTL